MLPFKSGPCASATRGACTTLLAGTLACLAATASATELGGTHVDFGLIDTLAGVPPPPGFYLGENVTVQTSSRFNNRNGDPATLNLGRLGRYPIESRSTPTANILSVAYVPDLTIPYINASFGTAMYGFFANSHAGITTRIGVPEAKGNVIDGFGDLTVVPVFLGFVVPNTGLNFILAPFDFTAPVGRYSPNDINNLGRNYWSYRPALEFTYLSKAGQEIDFNIQAAFNSQNQATHYKSGNEFYAGYAFQQYFSPKFALGFGGYWYKQVSDDTRNGQVVNTNTSAATFDTLGGGPGNRGETFAIGPIVSFNPGHGVSLQAHWDHEVFSYDRAQRELVYLRGVLRF